VPAAWDTTLVSQLKPDEESAAFAFAEEHYLAGEPVALAAIALNEVAFGYERARERRVEFGVLLTWLAAYVSSGVVEVLPVDERAAVVAGQLRARAPGAPRAARGDKRNKGQRRVAWFFDIQIAASAWVAGYEIATENTRDFERIGDLLAELAPAAPRLEVVPSPF